MDYLGKYSEQRSLIVFVFIDCIHLFVIFEEIEDIRSFRFDVSMSIHIVSSNFLAVIRHGRVSRKFKTLPSLKTISRSGRKKKKHKQRFIHRFDHRYFRCFSQHIWGIFFIAFTLFHVSPEIIFTRNCFPSITVMPQDFSEQVIKIHASNN